MAIKKEWEMKMFRGGTFKVDNIGHAAQIMDAFMLSINVPWKPVSLGSHYSFLIQEYRSSPDSWMTFAIVYEKDVFPKKKRSKKKVRKHGR